MTYFWLLGPSALSPVLIAGALLAGDRPVFTSGGQSADPHPSAADTQAGADSQARPTGYVTKSVQGRVVWMAEALERRFGVGVVPEARERLLALEAPDGQLVPIVEDPRGRSFRIDPRLREMDVELLVRQYRGSPMIQVIRIYEIKDGQKYIVDYWCDVCSIVMYQSGPCDCCQDQNHLRKRAADDVGHTGP